MNNDVVLLESFTRQLAAPVQQRGGPGVMIFTPFLQLQFLNREARRLLKLVAQADGIHATGVLPPEVTTLLKEIKQRLQQSKAAKDWEEVDLARTVDRGPVPVLLRGFGLPDPLDSKHSRILLLLEEIRRRDEFVSDHVKERFQLTPREQAVVEHLCKGLTNKEIAAALGICLPTVKEHIRSIMRKTKTSTRTAIMGEIVSLAG
jgi:DNA-binding NarL/FixJ family response regulator